MTAEFAFSGVACPKARAVYQELARAVAANVAEAGTDAPA
jgi:hypothetical protein